MNFRTHFENIYDSITIHRFSVSIYFDTMDKYRVISLAFVNIKMKFNYYNVYFFYVARFE